MEPELTKQDILELFARQSKEFHEKLLETDRRIEKSQMDVNKKIGELAGTWGKFVAEMVKPKIVELFKEKGIQIRTSLQNVEGFINDQRHYEIDLLLINSNVAVVVEVKSTLTRQDIDDHIKRLEKIKSVPPERVNLSGVTIFGAVAGMIVENNADRYAYQNGLYVLRQKGNIVEIVNDTKFQPKEWKVEY